MTIMRGLLFDIIDAEKSFFIKMRCKEPEHNF